MIMNIKNNVTKKQGKTRQGNAVMQNAILR